MNLTPTSPRTNDCYRCTPTPIEDFYDTHIWQKAFSRIPLASCLDGEMPPQYKTDQPLTNRDSMYTSPSYAQSYLFTSIRDSGSRHRGPRLRVCPPACEYLSSSGVQCTNMFANLTLDRAHGSVPHTDRPVSMAIQTYPLYKSANGSAGPY